MFSFVSQVISTSPNRIKGGRLGSGARVGSAWGFTLLEVLFAMAVMSVGLLGVSIMLTHTTQQQAVNANRAVATTLARDQLERIKRAAYANVITANYPPEAYGTIVGSKQFQQTVAIAIDTPLPNTKTVTVTVTWTDSSGVSRNATLNTVLAL